MSAAPAAFTVPEGFTLHKENSAAILLPATNDAFLNPVQEFNRDLSVACIRAWGERANADRERRWRAAAARRAAPNCPEGELRDAIDAALAALHLHVSERHEDRPLRAEEAIDAFRPRTVEFCPWPA